MPLQFDLHEEEEEEECRICRGPAEEGRPLYKPCKCSGSIAMTHQDCLKSWLEVKGGSGKCDLCKSKFHFAPKYAQDTPDKLSTLEVVSGISLRATSRWLPYALRVVLVAFVWLGILPLVTAYVYQGWMHRPASIKTRFEWELLPGDLVNGAILTVTIIISFLSLMSLGDFFRFNWQRDVVGDEDGNENEAGGEDANAQLKIAPVQIGEDRECLYYDDSARSLSEKFDAEKHIIEKMIRDSNKSVMDGGQLFHKYEDDSRDGDLIIEDSIDDLREMEMRFAAGEENDDRRHADAGLNQDNGRIPEGGVPAVRRQRHRQRLRDASIASDTGLDNDGRDQDEASTENESNGEGDDDEEEDQLFERMMRLQELGADEEPERNNRERVEPEVPEEGRFNPQFDPLDMPFDEDAAMDADLQMPLEQIIGLRGPISDLFRNLAWLLAFETTFIAIFGCIPRAIGSFTFNHLILRSDFCQRALGFLLKTILFVGFDLKTEDGDPIDLTLLVNIVTEYKSLLQPADVTNIIFGYISIAVITFTVQILVWGFQIYALMCEQNQSNPSQIEGEEIGLHNIDGIRLGPAGQMPMLRDPRDRADPDALRPEEMKAYLVEKFCTAVDCAAAISKITFLVCFKMFILPFLLGTWLDLSTLTLFDTKVEDRFAHAGADIVGFFLVHWVVGITFMLTVTVSVLQLREVLHPDLVAPSIRPQEPQTDLLVTLLQDSGWTHVKRMVPSLGIYAAILAMYVWLPCQVIKFASLQQFIPMFRPKFWYFLYSPLQRPLELLAFHLTVLSVLEKHKNTLGEMQHTFLLKVSGIFGITDFLLPREITEYVLIGERPLHKGEFLRNNNADVDSFWDQLVCMNKKGGATDELLESQMHLVKPSGTPASSQKVSNPDQFILLSPGTSSEHGRKLMPTRIGSFKFQKKIRNDGSSAIEIWRASVGEPIPRPPEGWDYLADGGAVEQGRWAWGKKEKKSDIEQKVAKRRHFFPHVLTEDSSTAQWKTSHFLTSGILMIMKLAAIAFASWVAVTLCASAALFAPLFIGRFSLWILKVPTQYVHDPFVFFAGGAVLAPIAPTFYNLLTGKYNETESQGDDVHRKRVFSLPPVRKVITLIEILSLCLVICPLVIGTIYHFFFVAIVPSSTTGLDASIILRSWPVGCMLMHSWAALCYVGAFRYEFWVKVRQLAIDGIAGGAPMERNDNRRQGEQQMGRNDDVHANQDGRALDDNGNDDDSAAPDTSSSLSWQGEKGFVASFVSTMYSILVNQEWEKIDQVALVYEFLIPVTQQILLVLLTPICAFSIAILATQVSTSFAQIFEEEIFRVYLYRYAVLFVITIQLAVGFQRTLASWYKAAHNAARDHRFLVGEELQDYNSMEESE